MRLVSWNILKGWAPLPRLPGAGKRKTMGIESLREPFLLPSNPSPDLVAPCLFTHYRGPRNAATPDKPGWTGKSGGIVGGVDRLAVSGGTQGRSGPASPHSSREGRLRDSRRARRREVWPRGPRAPR